MRRWRPIYGRRRCNPRWMKSVLSTPGTVSLVSERSGSSGSASQVLSSAGGGLLQLLSRTRPLPTDTRGPSGWGMVADFRVPARNRAPSRRILDTSAGWTRPAIFLVLYSPGSAPLSSISRRSLADRGSRLSRSFIRRRPYFHPANLLQRADNAVGQPLAPPFVRHGQAAQAEAGEGF